MILAFPDHAHYTIKISVTLKVFTQKVMAGKPPLFQLLYNPYNNNAGAQQVELFKSNSL